MENHPPSPQAQACSSANPPTESSFSFTPIKALSALPRLWDRKPSTPVRGGDKTRKLWKRIRLPFTGMMTATEGARSGIGASKNSDYQRGVKRLCVDPADADRETEPEQRGRSFLETKWEMQASRKKRKMPEFDFNIHQDQPQGVFGFTANQNAPVVGDAAMNGLPHSLSDLLETSKTPVYNDAMAEDQNLTAYDANTPEDLESRHSSQDAPTVIENAGEDKSHVVSNAEPMQDLTQEQEVKLVRSALRSSLDGEDAELLNDFLSKAKAKRAAKAADPEDAEAMDASSSPEVSPEIECSTPRSRRALEELTTNSPSPVKLHISPSKYDMKRGTDGAEDQEKTIFKEIKEEQAPSSPACRRSSRTKGSNTPNVRNTISLRRAKGTEFIFLQKTEAQQVALATKRNTRLNKGKSVSPNIALEALAQQSSAEKIQSDDQQDENSRNGPNFNGPSKSRKQVSWNEERMAEYEEYKEIPDDQEDEAEGDRCTNDVGTTPGPRPESKRSAKKAESSNRSSRSRTQKAGEHADGGAPESDLTAPTTAPAPATSRSRRVRRLGDSGIMGAGTPVKTGTRRTSKPPAASADAVAAAGPSTPIKGRRKLAPKSPRSSKLPAPASKSVADTTDQPFVSAIPTRSSKTADEVQRKSMLQMSAGCTPTARRVRSRS
ncbi:hypothetical protein N7457_007234 [Penicillium paradoxum]|uniref:uncharacterized protein n=1 Tax=Penicillium paradoxum TaxID=176176 RepID=UPI00254874E0|nr:uncharacterized protein N7457_007234 [Penicillium paradoxum]KAJ5779514.1 hypothetical protein N7457_007234 [Penicillium paradoxum]